MPELNETHLINRFKASNNIELIGELYKPYMPLVYGVCLKYLSNSELAKDAVMDIFEKLLVELKKHETPENFRVWLYVVAKNFCLMQLRSAKSENSAFKKMSKEFMENGFDLHPVDVEEPQDLSSVLKECIDKLKEEQRKAIELFYFKKLCYREIAEELCVEEKTIKSSIQNGKRNLKNCIETNS